MDMMDLFDAAAIFKKVQFEIDKMCIIVKIMYICKTFCYAHGIVCQLIPY